MRVGHAAERSAADAAAPALRLAGQQSAGTPLSQASLARSTAAESSAVLQRGAGTSGGSSASMRRLGNSLTLSTSTKSVLRRSRCTGSPASTASADRMDVASTTTSGCSSQKSLASPKNATPSAAAAGPCGERDGASTCGARVGARVGGRARAAPSVGSGARGAGGRRRPHCQAALRRGVKRAAVKGGGRCRGARLVAGGHQALGQELAEGAEADDADAQLALPRQQLLRLVLKVERHRRVQRAHAQRAGARQATWPAPSPLPAG